MLSVEFHNRVILIVYYPELCWEEVGIGWMYSEILR